MAQSVLQEVVVTAQKRSERLVDVPIAITALDSSAIAATGASSLADVEFSIPGLSSYSYGPGTTGFVQLRGISNLVGRPTVGRYFDEVPMNIEIVNAGMDVRLIDMQRVEILRGPQPTLYGDGSMGGTIRYVPAEPTLGGSPSAAVTAQFSTVNRGGTGWLGQGDLDLPLSKDRLGLRLAAGFAREGGWIDRVPTGERNINEGDIHTLRATFRWKPSDASDIKLFWQHVSTDTPNQNFGINGVTRLSVPTPLESDADLAGVVMRVDLGFAELVEAPGYYKYGSRQQLDLTPLYLPVLAAFGFPSGYITAIPYPLSYDAKIYTNALRLVSKGGTRWTWSTGVDYKSTRLSNGSSATTLPNALPFALLDSTVNQPDKVWALWGEASYAFNDRWRATVGVRYFHDEEDFSSSLTSFGAPSSTNDSATFTSTNPRFNLSYKITPDSMLYLDVAKGFRSGGFNYTDPAVPTYGPEALWTYELGSKGLYFDRRLELDTAVYYNDWRDVQANFYTPFGLTVTTNGGDIKGVGVDLSATLRPVKGIEVGATYGWNNMEYKRVPANGDKALGDPPDGSVRLAWSAFADYRYSVGNETTFYGRADLQHANRAQVTLRNPVFTSITNFPPRSLLKLRLGATFNRYDVSIFADNVLNETNPVFRAPFSLFAENLEQRPRTYGLTVRASF